jgi:murein DD-endopeptidase MepM/ murein hydrolase activator NlpD
MMTYTVRYAHLAETMLKPGETVNRGNQIGVMGNTGSGTGAHLHLDVVEGEQKGRYNLDDMANGDPRPSAKQAVLFIDQEIFQVDPVITTCYADLDYYLQRHKVHCAFDVVPWDRHKTPGHFRIYWNRSMPGRVIKILEDDPGYGNCVMIAYEA